MFETPIFSQESKTKVGLAWLEHETDVKHNNNEVIYTLNIEFVEGLASEMREFVKNNSNDETVNNVKEQIEILSMTVFKGGLNQAFPKILKQVRLKNETEKKIIAINYPIQEHSVHYIELLKLYNFFEVRPYNDQYRTLEGHKILVFRIEILEDNLIFNAKVRNQDINKYTGHVLHCQKNQNKLTA
jgi:hypothetical protein